MVIRSSICCANHVSHQPERQRWTFWWYVHIVVPVSCLICIRPLSGLVWSCDLGGKRSNNSSSSVVGITFPAAIIVTLLEVKQELTTVGRRTDSFSRDVGSG